MSRSNFDKPLTLDEAIEHAEEVAGSCTTSCQREHKQLADWLRELKERRKYGNAAACRAALKAVVDSAPEIMERVRHKDWLVFNVVDHLVGVAQSALSAPPRNCDAGTPEEQAKRFEEFCDSHTCTMDCKVHESWRHFFNACGLEKVSCGLIFAQMPYESGVAK